jgi:hypothetical protein
MTLLELLRQELPKRGGWPDGASKATSYCFIPGVHFWDDNGFRVDYSDLTTRELGEAIVTREQYSWDGTGLPPVGIDVEFTIGTYDIETDFYGILPAEGEIVEVIAHKTTSDGNNVAVVYWDDKGAGLSACFGSRCFRPLRTEAERAIDEMVRLSGVSIGAAKILYDAGYRK